MSLFRACLPQQRGGRYLTDGGLETTLIFHRGIELPQFASYTLLEKPGGREILEQYFIEYLEIAAEFGYGFILESVGWRANPDWAKKLGHSPAQLAEFTRQSIDMLIDLRDRYAGRIESVVVSGCIGPRGDGYVASDIMTPEVAEKYHGEQVRLYAESPADFITAMTITNIPEAIGIVRAAEKEKMPAVISFTVETDGKLPSGEELEQAIAETDRACATPPIYYMINCAHPTHFEKSLPAGAEWTSRIGGLRANASSKSHAELNDSTELDIGKPSALGLQYRDLLLRHPQIRVLGGCCGTDSRHVREIALACATCSG